MRDRNTSEQLEVEKRKVTQFLLSHLAYAPLQRGVPVEEVFELYKEKHASSVLTVDGFGRLLSGMPNLQRRCMSYKGVTRRFIVGMKLV